MCSTDYVGNVHTWYGEALSERVPGVAGCAAADWVVVHHLTPGALAARARTRVSTLAGETGLRQRTLCAHHTLRATRGGRPYVPGLAGTHAHAVVDAAHAVRTTRRRVARVHWHHSCNIHTVLQSSQTVYLLVTLVHFPAGTFAFWS